MLIPRVIPCLDVRAGRIVKGVRFQNLRDAGDPAERAAAYENEGADEIVILDVSATTEERAASIDTVARVREAISIPLTVGGGVRTIDDASRLLDAGADRVSVNSAAVNRPELLAEIAGRFGVQCCVLAVDASRSDGGGWRVLTRSGSTDSGLGVEDWAARGAALGAGEILLTSWNRDGTGAGYDLDLLRAVAKAAPIPIIASGGASTAAHMRDALDAGASAVLAASIFHDRVTTVADLKRELSSLGVSVRLPIPTGATP